MCWCRLPASQCLALVLNFSDARSGEPLRDIAPFLGAAAHIFLVPLEHSEESNHLRLSIPDAPGSSPSTTTSTPTHTCQLSGHAHAYPEPVEWYNNKQVFRWRTKPRPAGEEKVLCEDLRYDGQVSPRQLPPQFGPQIYAMVRLRPSDGWRAYFNFRRGDQLYAAAFEWKSQTPPPSPPAIPPTQPPPLLPTMVHSSPRIPSPLVPSPQMPSLPIAPFPIGSPPSPCPTGRAPMHDKALEGPPRAPCSPASLFPPVHPQNVSQINKQAQNSSLSDPGESQWRTQPRDKMKYTVISSWALLISLAAATLCMLIGICANRRQLHRFCVDCLVSAKSTRKDEFSRLGDASSGTEKNSRETLSSTPSSLEMSFT